MSKLILDTDIGTDVDDALALGVLLGSPEVDLVGVTTVYGDTLLRARLAGRLARRADPSIAIPFIPGAEQTLSGRPVWWPGHEGALFPDLTDERVDTTRTVVEFLTQTVAADPGQVDIVAVGPLTNIALALQHDPAFSTNLGRLIIMGGDFAHDGRRVEHNFRCDAVAAKEVFASGVRITVTGLDITTQVVLAQPEIDQIGDSGPLGIALRAEMEQFWKFYGHPWNNPHDPIAALTLIEPALFSTEFQPVRILTEGDDAGLAVTDTTSAGTCEVVTGLNPSGVAEQIVTRIGAASDRRPVS